MVAGTPISCQTIRNQPCAADLYTHIPMECFIISRVLCSESEQENTSTREEMDGKMSSSVTSLEINFNAYVLHIDGTRNNTAYKHSSIRFGGCKELIRDGTSIGARLYLHINTNESLKTQMHRNSILTPFYVSCA
ncbi:hypothetical protein TNCT_642961 [Trichonephila clavata]|uniref:Uncharacterized protein n=1 Tax=Trichonephila clavata TaxID=2740835 RepID=A0A8X6F289_TRICU|nr:hypothetical protein TNCT_642961 [Trichonephila clavata]